MEVMKIEKNAISYSDFLWEQNANGDFYCIYQKQTGLSDAEFWCIFYVYNGECNYQHELSNYLFMNKQTVNAALKQLVKKGLVQLAIPPENQRVRKIVLTEQGQVFSHKYLDYLAELEQKAWNTLSSEEQAVMLSGMKKINEALLNAIE